MTMFTIFKPTRDVASSFGNHSHLASFTDADQAPLNYSKISWFTKHLSSSQSELTKEQEKAGFKAIEDAINTGILHKCVEVEAESLSQVFRATNAYIVTDDYSDPNQNWTHNDNVKVFTNTAEALAKLEKEGKLSPDEQWDSELSISSTSVGDIIFDGENLHIVTECGGFKKL